MLCVLPVLLCTFLPIFVNAFAVFRLAHGDNVDPEKFPYVVNMEIDQDGKKSFCTGVLITRSVVMTAGHCVLKSSTSQTTFQVIAYKRVRNFTKIYARVKTVGEPIVFLDAGMSNDPSEGGYKDLALFVLERNLPICSSKSNRKFGIANLPDPNLDPNTWTRQNFDYGSRFDCTILGYGHTHYGEQDSKGVQLMKLKGQSLYAMAKRLIIPLRSLKQKGRICPADSGAPCICADQNGVPRLYGIASKSAGVLTKQKISPQRQCGSEQSVYVFDVFTDMRHLLPEIHSSLLKLGKMDEFHEDNKRCKQFNKH